MRGLSGTHSGKEVRAGHARGKLSVHPCLALYLLFYPHRKDTKERLLPEKKTLEELTNLQKEIPGIPRVYFLLGIEEQLAT